MMMITVINNHNFSACLEMLSTEIIMSDNYGSECNRLIVAVLYNIMNVMIVQVEM